MPQLVYGAFTLQSQSGRATAVLSPSRSFKEMQNDQPFTVTYDEVLGSAVIDIRGVQSVLPGTFESPEEAGEAAQMFFRTLLNRLTAANMNRDLLG